MDRGRSEIFCFVDWAGPCGGVESFKSWKLLILLQCVIIKKKSKGRDVSW